jgi:hypothetical protein
MKRDAMMKVDEQLQKLREELDADVTRLPVMVKCDKGSLDAVAQLVASLGGTVRHRVSLINTIAAWLPLSAVDTLAERDDVRNLHLEQEFNAA